MFPSSTGEKRFPDSKMCRYFKGSFKKFHKIVHFDVKNVRKTTNEIRMLLLNVIK